MLKKLLLFGLTGGLALAATTAQAQVTLGTSPYTENFNTLASGLPTGFSVAINATAASVGTAGTYTAAAAPWNNTGGGYKNFASATGLTTAASTADQAAATNRALGVRQTSTASTYDPGAAFVFQVANTTGKTDFNLSFKLQSLDDSSPRVTTWSVDYGVGATPTSFTVVGTGTTGGSAFTNNTVTASFGSALDNLSGPITIRVVALTGSTGSGNRASSAIDDFSLSWSAPTATTPNLTVTPSSLTFGSQNVTTTSTSQSYSLSGVNLTGATTLTTTGPFTISKDNTTFGTTLSYTAADIATAKSVYVKFTPTVTGAIIGSVANASAGATTRTVALTGTGADPNQTVFNFTNCTTALSDGWSQYSVTGAQVWACTTFGHDATDATGVASAANGVQMNGYLAGNVENEDWFISPGFNLTTYNFPLLSYWARTAFTGPALKLRVSTNYSGTGAPSAATWTDVSASFPAAGSDVWTQTSNINLSAFKGANVYVAFVYTSTVSGAARWTLDDIALTNSATPPAPTFLTDVANVAFGYQAINANADKTVNVSAADLTGNVTVASSSANFTVSKDATTFASSIILTPAELVASKPVTVRFRPTVANTNYTGTLTVSTPGAAAAKTVTLTGDTYDPTKTLELVNWNMEWFGSTTAGLGPTDKALQQTNAQTVLNFLKADVYALEEVVDTVRLRNVTAALSTALGVPYKYKICDYGSYADNIADPDYDQDQKLTFIYRSDIVKPTAFLGLLRCSQAQACAAYTPWASGRFPFLMTANVTLDNVTKKVNFIVIHAKANSTSTSANDYARRKAGSEQLKTLLESSYASDATLIVGDYNDVLEGTIATGVTPAVSSYDNFVSDTNYLPITLPLARAGLQSTSGFKTVIDNVIANKNMAPFYITGTAAIRTDAAALITNYATTTSDHYPVFSRYSLSQVLATKNARTASLGLYPNPATNSVRFDLAETGSNLSLHVYTVDGRLVLKGAGSVEQLNQQLSQRVSSLANGMYVVRVVGAQQTYTDRFQKQ